MIKKFYVCSYGGSGSKMLCRSLRKYGEVYHIHTRYPPDLLEYIGNEKNGKLISSNLIEYLYLKMK